MSSISKSSNTVKTLTIAIPTQSALHCEGGVSLSTTSGCALIVTNATFLVFLKDKTPYIHIISNSYMNRQEDEPIIRTQFV